ncbi:glycerate kinase family protein, partial [Ligilactobacillus sp.]|uniref:glycerate kinase family protein n=1 Tax=Ligilactobacillus sp. TaxID=2767921 RepID=UPI002FE380F8
MKILIAPDSFKGCMTAKEACAAIEKGLKNIDASAQIVKVPMADGGEGTVQALVDALNGKIITKKVTGPLNKPVNAFYGLIEQKHLAVIEMSAASGIQFVSSETADPLHATTYGTGELILDALQRGAKRFIIGLGGSATNDGGAGMAQALGVRFLDKNNQELPLGGIALGKLARIDRTQMTPLLDKAAFSIACDVSCPLTGKNGASFVFGPQKGATETDVKLLDNALAHYADIAAPELKDAFGAGAAGGLGFAMMAFLNAVPDPGARLIIDAVGLDKKAADCDLAITGEGSIDFQTAFGKTPMAVAECVRKNSPDCITVGLCGHLGKDVDMLYKKGFDALFPIVSGPQSLEDAVKNGELNLTRTSENVLRLIKRTKFS